MKLFSLVRWGNWVRDFQFVRVPIKSFLTNVRKVNPDEEFAGFELADFKEWASKNNIFVEASILEQSSINKPKEKKELIECWSGGGA